MDYVLEGIDGVVNISDDIIVFGGSEEEQDQNLDNMMNRSRTRH